MMYKQLALSAPLIGLLLCLTACNKKEIEKPAAQEKRTADIEQQVIHTTVGEEFKIEESTSLWPPTAWYLLDYEYPCNDCVEFVRDEYYDRSPAPSVGGGSTHVWVFRATKPGKKRIIMAHMLLDDDYDVWTYHETLVEVAPAEKKPATAA